MLKFFYHKYKLAFIAFLFTLGFFASIQYVWIEREVVISEAKKELLRLEASLNEVGYDISYDEIGFSNIPPFDIISVKNLKVYSLDGNNYVEWHIPLLNINTGLFDISSLKFKFSAEQYLQINGDKFKIDAPKVYLALDFSRDAGLVSLAFAGKDIEVGSYFKIGGIKLASQRMAVKQINDLAPFFENYLEVSDVDFPQDFDCIISQRLERLYLHANLVGVMKEEPTYEQSINSWLKLGGLFDVKKLVVNWDYLNLVGKGDLYFAENMEPKLHLNTSSKGLIKAMDSYQEKGFLDSKGVFVAKILLSNKSFTLNEGDDHKTVTTPININRDEMLIENISVKKFPQKETEESEFKVRNITHSLKL